MVLYFTFSTTVPNINNTTTAGIACLKAIVLQRTSHRLQSPTDNRAYQRISHNALFLNSKLYSVSWWHIRFLLSISADSSPKLCCVTSNAIYTFYSKQELFQMQRVYLSCNPNGRTAAWARDKKMRQMISNLFIAVDSIKGTISSNQPYFLPD